MYKELSHEEYRLRRIADINKFSNLTISKKNNIKKFELLTQKQKEALNILSIIYFNTNKTNKAKPKALISKILKSNLTLNWLNEIIEKKQLEKLYDEIAIYKLITKNK